MKQLIVGMYLLIIGSSCIVAMESERVEKIMSIIRDELDDINFIDDETGNALLHDVARINDIPVAKAILDYGANPDIVTTGKWQATPLQLAVIYRHRKMIDLLLEHGADINKDMPLLETALYCAIASRRLYDPHDNEKKAAIVLSLLAHGADPIPCLDCGADRPIGLINDILDFDNSILVRGREAFFATTPSDGQDKTFRAARKQWKRFKRKHSEILCFLS